MRERSELRRGIYWPHVWSPGERIIVLVKGSFRGKVETLTGLVCRDALNRANGGLLDRQNRYTSGNRYGRPHTSKVTPA